MTQLQSQWVDLAEEDGVSAAQITTLQQAGPPWTGVSLQCSNGRMTFSSWFPGAWQAAGPCDENPAYGQTTFRMAYHYFVFGDDAVAQADLALSTIDAAGGWSYGDLALGVDVENGEQPPGLTASMVEDGINAFSARVLANTGQAPILYGASLLRALGIKSRMGCAYYWFPEWNPVLDWKLVYEVGFDEDSTLLWQDVGDGSDTAPKGYPHTTPVGDQLDISTMVLSNMTYDQQIQWLVNYCSGTSS